MWGEQFTGPGSAYMSNNNLRVSKSAPCSPIKPNSNGPATRVDPFHVVHKVPMGDSPYVKAKHVQVQILLLPLHSIVQLLVAFYVMHAISVLDSY